MIFSNYQHRRIVKTIRKRTFTSGFTLIELIISIIILGVLAIIALPSFINLGQSARIASVQALGGAIQEAASNLRMLCVVHPQSGCDISNSQQLVTLEGQQYWMEYGWVDAGDDLNGNEVDIAINYSGFTPSLPNIYSTLFSRVDAPTPANCSVLYYQATVANPQPTITITTSGC